jgi:hypothetical protein
MAMNAMVGLVSVTGLGLTAYMIGDSWGGLYWLFPCVAGTVAGVLALLRGPQRTWPVAGGFTVVVGTWLTALPDAAGFTVVTVVDTVTWLVAVALGPSLRAARRGLVT